MSERKHDSLAIDLSIDFDFFVREDPFWDFGHQDNDLFASSLVWNSRYSTLDLYGQTNPLRYADFMPEQLVERISEDITPIRRFHHLGWADSHARATKFFLSDDVNGQPQASPGLIINIDAHHDGWDRGMAHPEPAAENWALHLQKEWPSTQFVQCYPKWKDASLDGTSAIRDVITFNSWNELAGGMALLKHERSYIRNIFVCSSQSWVPPHFDKDFISIVTRLAKRAIAAQELQRIRLRKAPSREEAKEMFSRHEAIMKEVHGAAGF